MSTQSCRETAAGYMLVTLRSKGYNGALPRVGRTAGADEADA